MSSLEGTTHVLFVARVPFYNNESVYLSHHDPSECEMLTWKNRHLSSVDGDDKVGGRSSCRVSGGRLTATRLLCRDRPLPWTSFSSKAPRQSPNNPWLALSQQPWLVTPRQDLPRSCGCTPCVTRRELSRNRPLFLVATCESFAVIGRYHGRLVQVRPEIEPTLLQRVYSSAHLRPHSQVLRDANPIVRPGASGWRPPPLSCVPSSLPHAVSPIQTPHPFFVMRRGWRSGVRR